MEVIQDVMSPGHCFWVREVGEVATEPCPYAICNYKKKKKKNFLEGPKLVLPWSAPCYVGRK